jgi:tetratricopeptide (TPR) repeat protein
MRLCAILIAFSLTAFGQRHKLEEVDAEKPEGKLLQQILQENDPAKKAPLMEQFATQYPKVEQTAWILEQLQGIYIKANQPDQIIAAGDKLLAVDPSDPEAALQCLKAAEAKKDAALIEKYSAMASANARKLAAAPQPKDADAVASWKAEVDYAKQVDTYTEYALYRAALESRDPKKTIELGEILEQRNPTGEYTAKARQPLFVAYRQSGANDKALALAERVVATDQSDEDMLLVVIDHYLQTKTQPEKVHAYSAKVVEVMAAKPKPEGTSDADWTARKNLVTGLAYYMSGKQYSNDNKFPQADQELRKALPMVESNPTLKPEVLFLLGLADFKLEKIQESANYFRLCAGLKSPFQGEASKNLQRIQRDYHGVK